MPSLGRLRTAAGRWTDDWLDLLFPPRCPVCGAGRIAGGPRGACEACAATLCRDGPRCGVCGSPGDGAGCRGCRSRRPGWKGIVVLGSYGDELRTAVLRAKRPAGERIAAGLGELIVRRHGETLSAWAADVVVPVPMHWLRRATRGTSAAGEIARAVAAGLGLPCRGLLRRQRATRMQNTLPTAERGANVRGAFRAAGRTAGLRILLVDDVTTTGSTLEACAAAAISAGASAVYAAVAARADAGSDHDA